MKVTNKGNVYGGEEATNQPVATSKNPLAISNSGVVYEKPSSNDVKNTEAFKVARAKYDSKEYAKLSEEEKDALALKDLEDAQSTEELANA